MPPRPRTHVPILERMVYAPQPVTHLPISRDAMKKRRRRARQMAAGTATPHKGRNYRPSANEMIELLRLQKMPKPAEAAYIMAWKMVHGKKEMELLRNYGFTIQGIEAITKWMQSQQKRLRGKNSFQQQLGMKKIVDALYRKIATEKQKMK